MSSLGEGLASFEEAVKAANATCVSPQPGLRFVHKEVTLLKTVDGWEAEQTNHQPPTEEELSGVQEIVQ